MDKKVRIGIIGCGGIANGKHMPALKKLANVEMVAFCDIIEEKAVKAAREFGVPGAKVFTDYKELLKLDLAVVHVLTPNKQHSFITVDALEAGKHVMCDKPMAINLSLIHISGCFCPFIPAETAPRCWRWRPATSA